MCNFSPIGKKFTTPEELNKYIAEDGLNVDTKLCFDEKYLYGE